MPARNEPRKRSVMLAYPFSLERVAKWDSFYIQPKLDGVRCEAHITPEKVTLLSSTGREITSVPHITEELMMLSDISITLDGELYSKHLSHQAINSIVSRTKSQHENFILIDFCIFDVISPGPQNTRLDQLESFFQRLQQTVPSDMQLFSVQVPTFKSSNLTDIETYLSLFMRQGYEGIIIRKSDMLYERKRSTGIVKYKPRKEDTYKIVGFQQEISKDGVPKEALGALILESDGQSFCVGSGSFLTRAMRIHLWDARMTLKDKIAVIKYQELTDGNIPRFPVLIDIQESS